MPKVVWSSYSTKTFTGKGKKAGSPSSRSGDATRMTVARDDSSLGQL